MVRGGGSKWKQLPWAGVGQEIVTYGSDGLWKSHENLLYINGRSIEHHKSQFEVERMRVESQIKRELMELEFNYNMQLGQQKINREQKREQEIENRKDKRAKIVGTQQSKMIDQKKNDLLPINFEDEESMSDVQPMSELENPPLGSENM